MSFSEKYGFKEKKEILQIKSIDDDLRNSLWSVLEMHCWGTAKLESYGYFLSAKSNTQLRHLCENLWLNFFKIPVDEIDSDWLIVKQKIREYYFSCHWYEVYDFVEFVFNNFSRPHFQNKFEKSCNLVLRKEMSAYRLISGVISKVTDEYELDEIKLAAQNKLDSVRSHIQRSIELLSDKNTPDYRNSIKESVSAIESLAGKILDEPNSSLGKLLNKLELETGLHPSLKAGLSKIYGYTSDESGIRHALTEQDNSNFDDAKFMLVMCCSFINYVESRISKL